MKIEFIKTEDIVKQILIENEKTRNDDMLLYYAYCLKQVRETELINGYREQYIFNFCENIFYTFFVSYRARKAYNIKTYETVSRCRRKIQAQCPELESERTKRLRAKKEEQFKDYARL